MLSLLGTISDWSCVGIAGSGQFNIEGFDENELFNVSYFPLAMLLLADMPGLIVEHLYICLSRSYIALSIALELGITSIESRTGFGWRRRVAADE